MARFFGLKISENDCFLLDFAEFYGFFDGHSDSQFLTFSSYNILIISLK